MEVDGTLWHVRCLRRRRGTDAVDPTGDEARLDFSCPGVVEPPTVVTLPMEGLVPVRPPPEELPDPDPDAE